jgi:hypothetical protein
VAVEDAIRVTVDETLLLEDGEFQAIAGPAIEAILIGVPCCMGKEELTKVFVVHVLQLFELLL